MSTIAAIATPPGQGGIGIIRISGPQALDILKKISGREDFPPWKLRHVEIHDTDGQPIDEALAAHMPGPKTFTGEDVVEIQAHGAPFPLRMILGTVIAHGARQADRGEFTRRAFLNGRIDLCQAEAVAELIAAPSREAVAYGLNRLRGLMGDKVNAFREEVNNLRALAAIGIDFPDDEVEAVDRADFLAKTRSLKQELESLARAAARANIMQQGATILLAGPVNAGKSSLLNTLSGSERALVTDLPGTTRDFLEARIDLDGLPARLIDTAGFRNDASADIIENLGIQKTRELVQTADLVLLLHDLTADKEAQAPVFLELERLTKDVPAMHVYNKADLVDGHPAEGIAISARTGQNVESLIQAIRSRLLERSEAQIPEDGVAPNMRQAIAIEKALGLLKELESDLENSTPYDLCVTHLDGVGSILDEILGLETHDELLDRIFSSFCIGK